MTQIVIEESDEPTSLDSEVQFTDFFRSPKAWFMHSRTTMLARTLMTLCLITSLVITLASI